MSSLKLKAYIELRVWEEKEHFGGKCLQGTDLENTVIQNV